MNRACALNLVFPLIGLFLLLNFRVGPGFEPSQSFFAWFITGAVFQLAAALMLLRPKPLAWRRGWTMLWVACAAYMGGYSNLYLQRTPVATDRADLYLLQTLPPRIAELTERIGTLEAERGGAEAKSDLQLAELRAEHETRTKALAEKRARLAAKFPGRALDEGLRAELTPLEEGFAALEYVMSLLFLSSFFSLGTFVTRRAMDTYQIRHPELEDPLAFKAQYGL